MYLFSKVANPSHTASAFFQTAALQLVERCTWRAKAMAIQRHDDASRHDTRDGARLWEALRSLSDAQREDVERALARTRGVDKDGETPDVDFGAKVVVTVPSGGNNATPEEWAPHEFARVILRHVRELVHEQAKAEAPGQEESSPEEGFTLSTENFPSLGAKTNSKGPAAKTLVPVGKTGKRRITTTLVSTDATFAAVAVNPPIALVAPKSSINTPASAWTKRDLLERRMGVSNQIGEENPSPVKSTISRRVSLLTGGDDPPSPAIATVKPKPRRIEMDPWNSPPVSIQSSERKPPRLVLGDKMKRSKRVVTETVDPRVEQPDETTVESMAVPQSGANLHAARLYGQLILHRFAPSICAELKFLVGLLYRVNCTDRTCDSTKRNEFCCREASCAFALAALVALEPLLMHLGKDMLEVLLKTLDEVHGNPKLASTLKSSLHLREQQRVEESARIGCELPIETNVTTFRDYALPFCEDVDSRLNYRTPSESVIYSNREKIRDAFLSQLRSYQKQQNSLLGAQSGTSGPSNLACDSQDLLREVMPENHWWFARFFALELVQVGSNPLGESDKDLVMKIMEDKHVVRNPNRLRKLHRRFSSQPTQDSTVNTRRTANTVNGNKNKSTNTNGPEHRNASTQPRHEAPHRVRPHNSPTNQSPERRSRQHDTKAYSSTEAYDHMRSYFGDNQAFFFHFLVSCDSYQFAELVKHQLESQFISIWHTKPRTDPRKEFTETVLRLKVLAKFIGFLKFSPQWHWSSLTSAVTSKNPALEAAQLEAVATLEQAQSVNAFDVLALLEESIRSKKIAKCIPWLCDFLMMSSSDALSSSTSYFQKVIELLACIHRSELLERQGETGLYVAMQIEHLFHHLGIDHLYPTPMFRQQRGDIPSWVQPGTYQALVMDEVALTRNEDSCDMVPFLYSNLFLQVCLSELEDLRGFIQTRARGSHSRAGARGAIDRAPAIRKVRPLQVLRDDQINGSSLADAITLSKGNVRMKDSAKVPAKTGESPLRGAFFKQYPQVKRSVEFVVDVVVTNICEHAIANYVKPNADILIDNCVARAKANAPAFTQLILHEFQMRLDEQLEQFVATTVTNALEEAESLCESRVEEALKPLMAPSIPLQAVAAATKIAQAQAETALASVLTRSLRSEFLKRIALRKRAIVKESGVPVAGAEVSSTSSEGKDDTPDSVTRTLKFSFDETLDEDPLIDSVDSIKRNIVGMADTYERAAVSPSSRGMLKSALRYHRAFLTSLKEAVTNIGSATTAIRRKHASEIWSWVWRAIRLWLKTFALLASTDYIVDAPHGVVEAADEFISMLDVINDFGSYSSGRSVAPLHRLISESVQSIAARGNSADVQTRTQLVEACARVIFHVKDRRAAFEVPRNINSLYEYSANYTTTA